MFKGYNCALIGAMTPACVFAFFTFISDADARRMWAKSDGMFPKQTTNY